MSPSATERERGWKEAVLISIMTLVSGFALLLKSKLFQAQQLGLAERVCRISSDASSVLTQIES